MAQFCRSCSRVLRLFPESGPFIPVSISRPRVIRYYLSLVLPVTNPINKRRFSYSAPSNNLFHPIKVSYDNLCLHQPVTVSPECLSSACVLRFLSKSDALLLARVFRRLHSPGWTHGSIFFSKTFNYLSIFFLSLDSFLFFWVHDLRSVTFRQVMNLSFSSYYKKEKDFDYLLICFEMWILFSFSSQNIFRSDALRRCDVSTS